MKGRRHVRDANTCRCPDACGLDLKRDIGLRHAQQLRQRIYVHDLIEAFHCPCNRDGERDHPRRWWRRWRARLEVGVEAAGPISEVEAAIGCVNESARLEEQATLGHGVIDIPTGAVREEEGSGTWTESRRACGATAGSPKRHLGLHIGCTRSSPCPLASLQLAPQGASAKNEGSVATPADI